LQEQAKIEADSARVLAERARNRHLSAWQGLAAVMGGDGMPPRRLAGNVQDGMGHVTWDEAIQRLWGQSPELASARAGVSLPNAQASLKLTAAGYQQGELGYLSLWTAQRTFFQTSLAYLEALRELRSAAATIEGNLLGDSLRTGAGGP
jgi:outer membrane protein TolC